MNHVWIFLMDTATTTTSSSTSNRKRRYLGDSSQSSHFTFAIGDLNYRTRLPDIEIGSERHIKLCHSMARKEDWITINKYDELRGSLNKRECLVGYETPYCNFPPTFKVTRHENEYKYNVKRSPSYTDRILYKKAPDLLNSSLRLLMYEPVSGFVSSDHKPIRSAFTVRLNKELKWKPISTTRITIPSKMKIKKKKDDDDNDKLTTLDDDDVHYYVDDDEDNTILDPITSFHMKSIRETMHFFVSDIQCSINPNKYDQIRKQEKAELPCPQVVFASNPPDAIIIMDDDYSLKLAQRKSMSSSPSTKGIMSSLPSTKGFDNAKKKATTTKSNKKNGGFPSTTKLKDTMRPSWKNKNDYVHFALRTHTSDGSPIDFDGAQLHISLLDAKTGDIIGSHCINLAHLITISRERKKKTQPSQPPPQMRKCQGYKIVPNPSKALLSVSPYMSQQSFAYRPRNNSINDGAITLFPDAVQKAAAEISSSTATKPWNARGNNNKKIKKKSRGLDEFGIKSLRFNNEPLIEGGLVVGHIKCCIDTWWMDG